MAASQSENCLFFVFIHQTNELTIFTGIIMVDQSPTGNYAFS